MHKVINQLNRQKVKKLTKHENILYFELTKALNENGYYASLELTYDELKDKQGFLSCSNNDILEKAYYRNFSRT